MESTDLKRDEKVSLIECAIVFGTARTAFLRPQLDFDN